MPRILVAIALFFNICGRILGLPVIEKQGENHWSDLARDELEAKLKEKPNFNVAKNVIIFIGDGMGMSVVSAGRIYKGQSNDKHEEAKLSFEKFPFTGLSKTYNADKQVADSASTATAILTGVKVRQNTIGVSDKVTWKNCAEATNDVNPPKSVLEWAQLAGKDTGIVTTTRITHATPAAGYAHSASRKWECDGAIPEKDAGCVDIARQLIEGDVGKRLNVIFGGGRQMFLDSVNPEEAESGECLRKDKLNLLEKWALHKSSSNISALYVSKRKELLDANVNNVDQIMGLFAMSHLPYDYEDKNGPDGAPYLHEMVTVAIDRLQKQPEGYLLLVEGGRIDHALHENFARRALHEVLSFDKAIQAAVDKVDLNKTLIIVTADHSHGMTINGYAPINNDILGIADVSEVDHLPYTTIMFASGPGYNYTTNGTHATRPDLTNVDTTSFDYQQQATVPREYDDGAHSGEDVPIYAIGPMAHLFTGVHQQHYIAHAIKYASCIGDESCVLTAGRHGSSY